MEKKDPDCATFLKRYGYLPSERRARHRRRKMPTQQKTDDVRQKHVTIRRRDAIRRKPSRGAVKLALRQLQEFAGLRKTGKFDQQTRELMTRKRCTRADPVSMVMTRSTRSATGDVMENTGTVQPWQKRDLTYRINQYPGENHLLPSEVDEVIARAFQTWEEVCPLTFQAIDNEADIEIKFSRGNHGDDTPFDGAGHTLAHAYSPGEGIHGDVHFDDAEMWTADSPMGTNLYMVALHEFGHSLGLVHSDNADSVMFPWYPGYQGSSYTLPAVDVTAIQALYGES
ncbi:PREDICTED: matrix metalloproteinase-18-like [Branchiostoma belcheri]|uniref:Matrix metalloproteinase-18-like n=1 Tax=Branchiostoma belcheri TaxID=7741 RepID=A0A6P4XTS6_BRABE|nr:PREDICTED: matrix metalloproteinase-18-like [Branchiostoma belcheri]